MRAIRPFDECSNARLLAFQIGVLRRFDFRSIAIPFAGGPDVAWYLAASRKRVAINDIAESVFWSSRALVGSDAEEPDAGEVDFILSRGDGATLENEALLAWLPPDTAAWFDGIRRAISEVDSAGRRAVALRWGLLTLDYALSFVSIDASPPRALADVYRTIGKEDRPKLRQSAASEVSREEGLAFVERSRSDLLLLEFPGPHGLPAWRSTRRGCYEVWLRRSDEFFDEACTARCDRFGGPFTNKSSYLRAMDRVYAAASRFHTWTILFTESGWLTLGEMFDVVGRHRPVQTSYSKDLTEIPGGRRHYVISSFLT